METLLTYTMASKTILQHDEHSAVSLGFLVKMTLVNTAQQLTPNSAVGSQTFTSKGNSDLRNDYLQRQSDL